jgi:hypothetical protein
MTASKTKSKTKISALGALADAGRDLHARQPRWPNPDRLVRVGLVEVLMSQRRLPRTSGDVDIYEALERQGLVERQGGKLAFVATALGRSIPLSAFSAQDRQSASEGIEDVGYARGRTKVSVARTGAARRAGRTTARLGRTAGTTTSEPTITLYRAADSDYLDEGYSFAERKAVARLYLDNPGYGGQYLFRAKVHYKPEQVADLRDKSADEVAHALGLPLPGAVTTDVWITHLASVRARKLLAKEGYHWALVRESYPDGATTWVWLGGGEEPELERIE